MALKQTPGSLQTPDGGYYVTLTDGAGNLNNLSSVGYPTPAGAGATALHNSSGNVAAATAQAILGNAAGLTTYITGMQFTATGATATSVVNGTITGLLGGTLTFTVAVPASVTQTIEPVMLQFNPPFPASAVNTSIVASVPTLGAGNTNATISAWGYRV